MLVAQRDEALFYSFSLLNDAVERSVLSEKMVLYRDVFCPKERCFVHRCVLPEERVLYRDVFCPNRKHWIASNLVQKCFVQTGKTGFLATLYRSVLSEKMLLYRNVFCPKKMLYRDVFFPKKVVLRCDSSEQETVDF